MLVGMYILNGLPRNLPAGFEKSRAVGRRFTGSVGATAGAEGSSEAALSGAEAPAPANWAYPDVAHAAHASRIAAAAHSHPPTCLRPACPRRLTAAFFCCSNTHRPNKCMVPLHDMIPLQELLRNVGRSFQRRPESFSGRRLVSSHHHSNLQPGRWPFAYRVNTLAEFDSFPEDPLWPPAVGAHAVGQPLAIRSHCHLRYYQDSLRVRRPTTRTHA